jgi:DNA-binding protein YbaB
LNIAAGLGTVTVDGMGTLIAVELDSDAVETQTEASLARQVLCAINDAESAALTRRDAMIAEAEKEAGRR